MSEDLRLRQFVRQRGGAWIQAEPGLSAWVSPDNRPEHCSNPSPSGLRGSPLPMPFVVVSVGAGWGSAAVGWSVTTNNGQDLPSVQSTIQAKLAQDLSINDIVTFDAGIVGAVVQA